jgi:hypothetical protein
MAYVNCSDRSGRVLALLFSVVHVSVFNLGQEIDFPDNMFRSCPQFRIKMIGLFEGGPVLKVQVFVTYGQRATSRCHLHILVRQVKEK